MTPAVLLGEIDTTQIRRRKPAAGPPSTVTVTLVLGVAEVWIPMWAVARSGGRRIGQAAW
jgi:hypothetical protein